MYARSVVFIPSYGFGQIADAVEKFKSETKEDVRLLLIDGCFKRDEAFRKSVLKNRDWIDVIENAAHSSLPKIFGQCDVFCSRI